MELSKILKIVWNAAMIVFMLSALIAIFTLGFLINGNLPMGRALVAGASIVVFILFVVGFAGAMYVFANLWHSG